MGRAIVIATMVVVLGGLGAFLVVWLAKLGHRERAQAEGWAVKGDLNKRQELELQGQLDRAATIFESLTKLDGQLDDMPYIPTKYRDQIANWLQVNNKRRNT